MPYRIKKLLCLGQMRLWIHHIRLFHADVARDACSQKEGVIYTLFQAKVHPHLIGKKKGTR